MSMDILDIIGKLGEKERRVTDLEFISPVFFNDTVITRIDGLVYKFSIPKTAPGWYKIRPVDQDKVRVVGEANYADREKYLKCLGKLRVTLTFKKGDVFLAVPDKANKYKLPTNAPLPILLCEDTVLNFDRVLVRYDGANFWFEGVDTTNDPAKAEYLRDSLEKYIDPEKLIYKNLTFEERLSYTLRASFDKKFLEDKKEISIKNDVEHAGGKFVRFVERKDHYSVTYRVDGEEFTSHISKDNRRMVIAAGICLSGNDSSFDLKSLITVVREAQQTGVLHRFSNVQ